MLFAAIGSKTDFFSTLFMRAKRSRAAGAYRSALSEVEGPS
jgi:hypothetical protein